MTEEGGEGGKAEKSYNDVGSDLFGLAHEEGPEERVIHLVGYPTPAHCSREVIRACVEDRQ
jgi:hypothetical protein